MVVFYYPLSSEIKIDSKQVNVQDAKLHYVEAGRPSSPSVLLLHSASKNSQTWVDIGTINLLAKQRYRAVAVDLYSNGSFATRKSSPQDFLLELMEKLNLKLPILVSPSLSGLYSLPFVANYADNLKGFVPIAPVGILKFSQQLQGIKLPTLSVCGSKDTMAAQDETLVKLMPNAQKVVLENAGRDCYLEATEEFHKYLVKFVRDCSFFKQKSCC
ncbi:alpha/beta fold hydrolase [Oscillatoria salina]|uniref:alpha/beta fold hydrolase n=1 Tax=Oscillatoria salina TaxID=331517 RepID=UPI0013BC2006|nr:alpha/beta hydrolase [Oscillatoria salina]MBZ8181523.1 alpha/beta hydrolase [Oscillatoria salina IIICB1]NET91333.1 alpha/beta hydrolase [Kamptonema sp. SIO1D9]